MFIGNLGYLQSWRKYFVRDSTSKNIDYNFKKKGSSLFNMQYFEESHYF